MYTFLAALAPNGILPGAKFTLRPSFAFSYIGSVTARQLSSGRQPNFAAWYKEWNYRTFATGHFRSQERKPPNGILPAGKFTANRTRAQQQLRWATVATIDMGRKEGAAVPLGGLSCDRM